MYAGMNREEWLKERRSGIGGSDVAAILGLSPWKSPVEVWLDKRGQSKPHEETEAMRIGTELEDFVARRYEQETGREVRNFNTMLRDGCRIGNIDRLVVPEGAKVASFKREVRTDRALECKTSSVDWDGELPAYYYTQVLHYMGLMPTVQTMDVACLFLNHKHFEIFPVTRDDDTISALIAKEEEWWQKHIVEGFPPEARNEADARALWAHSKPMTQVTASEGIAKMIASYKIVDKQIADLEERKQSIKDMILPYIGENEAIVDMEGKTLCTWKSNKDSQKTDWKAIVKESGIADDIIKAHTVTTAGARIFRVK